tara:strand:- start:349 stop:1638 length:1290 start_codon:yes stop_codon:yes gene_type:complete
MDKVILIGLGKKKEMTLDKLRQASATITKIAEGKGIKKLITNMPDIKIKGMAAIDVGQTIAEGAILSLYKFNQYKSEKNNYEKKLSELTLLTENEKNVKTLKSGVSIAQKITAAVYFTRDLINHPGNTATPTYMAEQARKMAKQCNIKCKILNKPDMEKMGMGALLGVAKGSHQPPKFIILEYWGTKKNKAPVVLVGKGLTFDSGGISIKPSNGMEEMKTDMSGGAGMMGAIMAAASLKLPVNVVTLVPATENMPGGRANKPGDVLKTMSGKTIEVLNTDAEGRLILADALTYAEKYKPKAVIDMATLTGACVIALGHHATGLLGTDEKLIDAVKKAGEVTGERLWRFPLWEEYDEMIKSDIADVKNIGGRGAGTITAAGLLKKFASEYPWAHLDIAGTAWTEKAKPYVPKGAVGIGVRMIVQYLRSLF